MPRMPHLRSTIALALIASVAAACGGDSGNASNRQIDLAPAKKAEPQLADQPLPKSQPEKAAVKAPPKKQEAPPPKPEPAPEPRTEAPVAAAPAPAPAAAVATPAPAPRTGTVDVGTSFTVKPAVKICTNTHKVGDRFTATLANEVQGSNGAVIPPGSVAILRIVDAGSSTAKTDSAHIAFDILSLRVGDQTYEVSAHVTQSAPLDRVNSQSTTDKAKKVGVGAAIGAIAGRILGGNTRSTVLGGVVGGAAGAAVAAGDNHYDGCLKDDGAITLALDKPLVLKLAPAP